MRRSPNVAESTSAEEPGQSSCGQEIKMCAFPDSLGKENMIIPEDAEEKVGTYIYCSVFVSNSCLHSADPIQFVLDNN